ncbi:hypothetical protein A3K63_00170 [Candidatus Micrarchaeota archaeon RBG_16_49_10]|nr:MAG: hypothetical protein A3K63_00170 [Candidatus Micrarchaeota archaeon RBG_16_49_10]
MSLYGLRENDYFKFVIPVRDGVGKLYIYPLGAVQKILEPATYMPTHKQIAINLGFSPEQVMGGDLKNTTSGLIFDKTFSPFTVSAASEEIYNKALENGVVIMQRI